jgi:hypothetical protein
VTLEELGFSIGHDVFGRSDMVGVVRAIDQSNVGRTKAGGVVAMRPLIVHASSKVRVDAPRRVLHIEYASTVRLDCDIDLAVG